MPKRIPQNLSPSLRYPIRRFACLWGLLCLSFALAGNAHAGRAARGSDGQFGMVLGHQQNFGLSFPSANPFVEMRLGYQVTDTFLGRIDIGAGYSKIAHSDQATFVDGTLLSVNCSLALLYTPRLSDDVYLTLGGMIGPWFTALWGDNLSGVGVTTAGTPTDYLEQTVFAYGAVLGLEWAVAPRWAFVAEARYNLAMSSLGPYEGNLGGLGVFVGFLYRISAYHTEMPK